MFYLPNRLYLINIEDQSHTPVLSMQICLLLLCCCCFLFYFVLFGFSFFFFLVLFLFVCCCCCCVVAISIYKDSVSHILSPQIGQLFAMYLIASMVIRGNDDVKDKKETAIEYQHDACKYIMLKT